MPWIHWFSIFIKVNWIFIQFLKNGAHSVGFRPLFVILSFCVDGCLIGSALLGIGFESTMDLTFRWANLKPHGHRYNHEPKQWLPSFQESSSYTVVHPLTVFYLDLMQNYL